MCFFLFRNRKTHEDRMKPLEKQAKQIEGLKKEYEVKIKTLTNGSQSKSAELTKLDEQKYEHENRLARAKGDFEVIKYTIYS